LGTIGDIDPQAPTSVIEAHRHFSLTAGFVGAALLALSVGLAGYSYSAAPKTSLCALLVFAIPFLGLFAMVWW
jgi:hypothetical protein